jgi:hypothetical protein
MADMDDNADVADISNGPGTKVRSYFALFFRPAVSFEQLHSSTAIRELLGFAVLAQVDCLCVPLDHSRLSLLWWHIICLPSVTGPPEIMRKRS